VYLSLHPVFIGQWLNSARVRPLDYDYLKALTPAAQRFYELVSYSSSRHSIQACARQTFYTRNTAWFPPKNVIDYENFRVQMYKVCRPQPQIRLYPNVRHEATADSEGSWIGLWCTRRGPRRKAEYGSFNKQRLAPNDEGRKSRIPTAGTCIAHPRDPLTAEELVSGFIKRFHGRSKGLSRSKRIKPGTNADRQTRP